MSRLRKCKLGDYIEVLTDYHANGSYESLKENVSLLENKDYAIMIRTLNFERDDFYDDLIYVDKHAYDHLHKSKVYPDDILTNKIANPGSIYIMPDLNYPVTCGMNLFLIRFKDCVNQRYMYYCMKNSESYIKSFAHGTTTKTITKDEIRDISLYFHNDIKEQERIESLLSNLDRKIQNNNKINRTLLKMASETYMHSFFKMKPNGKIRDVLVENQKSNIKVGEAKRLGGRYPFFTSGDSILEWDNYLTDGRNCYLNTGGNADVKFYVGKSAYSTDTWSISTRGELTDYLFMLLNVIKPELSQKYFQGTGLKHLQKSLLKDKEIYILSQAEANAFNETIQPMLNLVSVNTRENQDLVRLRDWILPILMNGQADVLA